MRLECILCITLSFLMIALSDKKSTGRQITCDAGMFSPGQPAAVTCNLHTNVSATKRTVNVVRYRQTTPTLDLGTDILVCQWKPEKQKHNCIVADGYTFHNISHEPLTINIPAVTEEYAGLYTCFFVPPQDEQKSHACELIVKDVSGGAGTLPQTTMKNLQTGKGEQSHITILTIGIILVVVALVLFGVYFFRKRRSTKQKKKIKRDENVDPAMAHPLMPIGNDHEQFLGEGEAFVQQPWEGPNEQEILKGFAMDNEGCQEVMSLLQTEIKANFSKEASATIKMFSTLVKGLPTGQEKGQFMVVKLGSRFVRILFVKIKDDGIETSGSENYKIPQDVRLGTCIQLLNFLENRLSMFVTSNQLDNKETFVGVVFAFPCKYADEDDLATAQPLKWTKGFNCDGVLGKDFGKLLQKQMKNKSTTGKLTIKAIINDAVGVLIAGVHKDKACRIGLVIGKGVNGCYIKDNEPDGTAEGHTTGKTIISTEWGALGENGCLEKFTTDFDRSAVKFSMRPKQQILEKMVGRLYIGEIVRQVLLKMTKEGHLFKSVHSELPALNEKRGFTTESVLGIDSDMDQECFPTKELLRKLEFHNVGDRDCRLVKFVCRIVLQRAAYLSAAALATLVQQVEQRHVTVAIDGSMWRSHPRFKQQMMAKTKELVGPNFEVKFLSIIDGSEIGAALITAL